MSDTATLERRAAILEISANGRRLEGYAATFGTETRIGNRFVEVIMPGAFSASLKAGGDILALVDHDATRVLARTRSGTLRLSEDTRGLAFSLDLPGTTAGRDVLALAERGDLGGMSFGFSVRKNGESWLGDRRELHAVDLFEISVVSAFPAYPDTSVAARSRLAFSPRLAIARRYLDLMEAMR
ncbi:HK97 family phage prohead protease [Pleomorphomonas sp. JP5]|uniref:HK97 family phage prohead protease n=1 Tax=Pleomorphomonas sp. JP5 TaxID=2942998 RepID=UPI002044100B|nr:HK97 family phage prohead protease [Pleomorphomonas sp. JP5]MCM5558075.1 HK97 family phage prohead protease [Pleomorphomonas sp. JP5]